MKNIAYIVGKTTDEYSSTDITNLFVSLNEQTANNKLAELKAKQDYNRKILDEKNLKFFEINAKYPYPKDYNYKTDINIHSEIIDKRNKDYAILYKEIEEKYNIKSDDLSQYCGSHFWINEVEII